MTGHRTRSNSDEFRRGAGSSGTAIGGVTDLQGPVPRPEPDSPPSPQRSAELLGPRLVCVRRRSPALRCRASPRPVLDLAGPPPGNSRAPPRAARSTAGYGQSRRTNWAKAAAKISTSRIAERDGRPGPHAGILAGRSLTLPIRATRRGDERDRRARPQAVLRGRRPAVEGERAAGRTSRRRSRAPRPGRRSRSAPSGPARAWSPRCTSTGPPGSAPSAASSSGPTLSWQLPNRSTHQTSAEMRTAVLDPGQAEQPRRHAAGVDGLAEVLEVGAERELTDRRRQDVAARRRSGPGAGSR